MVREHSLIDPKVQHQPRKIRQRILVVDDDVDQANVLCHRLQTLGFDCETASTGQAALRRARAGDVQLVLLDIGLPDVDGLAVCSELNDDCATCEMPVILLSGLDDPEMVRRVRASGGRYFVRKPYDPNVLLLIIESALGQSK